MLDTKQFISSIKQIAEEKGIPEDKVIETIEAAIAAAYKKDYGKKGQIIRTKLNPETGDITVSQIKFVVEGVDEEGNVIGPLPDRPDADVEVSPELLSRPNGESPPATPTPLSTSGNVGTGRPDADVAPRVEPPSRSRSYPAVETPEPDIVGGGTGDSQRRENIGTGALGTGTVKFNPEKYLTLEEARKVKKKAKVGDEIITGLEPKTDFGRIAAQTAKQVIIQRLREIERQVIFAEFKQKEGEVISGTIQRNERRMVYVDLGKTNGLLVPAEQIPQDNYRLGQRLRFLILRVEETSRGPVVLLSRSHPKLVLKLFEFEVPEIEAGSVEIKTIAREAGSRSKIAVVSNEEGVDPIGSLVGQKGVRVQTVINELAGEKIDIIEYSDDPAKFITYALSPAKILAVRILDEKYRHALVEVADDQFSLAIGKKGQNVRLAAKLTGWKIDVRAPQGKLTTEEALSEQEVN